MSLDDTFGDFDLGNLRRVNHLIDRGVLKYVAIPDDAIMYGGLDHVFRGSVIVDGE